MTNAAYQSTRMTAADLKVAIAFTKTVHILYGEITEHGDVATGSLQWREIEPHEVRETKDGNLIVIAMCRLRGERRTFRLDRISHYNFGTRGFLLPWPEKADPEEITDWWTVTSKTGHEITQVEVVVPSDVPYGERYRYVGDEVRRRSAKVRAVSKAEGGIGLRRLRRKDVLTWR